METSLSSFASSLEEVLQPILPILFPLLQRILLHPHNLQLTQTIPIDATTTTSRNYMQSKLNIIYYVRETESLWQRVESCVK